MHPKTDKHCSTPILNPFNSMCVYWSMTTEYLQMKPSISSIIISRGPQGCGYRETLGAVREGWTSSLHQQTHCVQCKPSLMPSHTPMPRITHHTSTPVCESESPCVHSASSHSPESAPAAAWRAGVPPAAWTTREHR